MPPGIAQAGRVVRSGEPLALHGLSNTLEGVAARGHVVWRAGEAPVEEATSLWPDDYVPNLTSTTGPGIWVGTLGVQFMPLVNGNAVGLRYYRAPHQGSTEPLTSRLWRADGTELGTITFPPSSDTGWQNAYFSSPVPLQAQTVYISAVTFTEGYQETISYFNNPRFSPDNLLIAPASSMVHNGNGVYVQSPGIFPYLNHMASNYWVDVLFTPGERPSGILVYSSNEQDTGMKWLDGKTFWQKTIVCPSLPAFSVNGGVLGRPMGWTEQNPSGDPHGISIETLVDVWGTAMGSALPTLPLPFTFSTSDWANVGIWVSPTHLWFITGEWRLNYNRVFVTLLYTRPQD